MDDYNNCSSAGTSCFLHIFFAYFVDGGENTKIKVSFFYVTNILCIYECISANDLQNERKLRSVRICYHLT